MQLSAQDPPSTTDPEPQAGLQALPEGIILIIIGIATSEVVIWWPLNPEALLDFMQTTPLFHL